MFKCVKITCIAQSSQKLSTNIQKQARQLQIEGILQIVDAHNIRIIASGPKEKIDLFIDALYKLGSAQKPFSLEVEPFLKDKDYRGIFRVIE